jgi:hypothetical protein
MIEKSKQWVHNWEEGLRGEKAIWNPRSFVFMKIVKLKTEGRME